MKIVVNYTLIIKILEKGNNTSPVINVKYNYKNIKSCLTNSQELDLFDIYKLYL